MHRIVEVKAHDDYTVSLVFEDGVRGSADLSHLKEKGLFRAWSDRTFFLSPQIGNDGALRWGEDIEICPDALYLRVTGKRPEDLFSMPVSETTHA